MNGSEVFTVIGSMFLSFLLGFVGMMLIGGKMSLNYLLVKMSRGRKVLIFGKTNFGWKSFVAKKENNSVKWKYDGKTFSKPRHGISKVYRANADGEEPSETRPTILMDITFNGFTYKDIEVGLDARPRSGSDLLVNRDLMRQMNISVNPNRTFVLSKRLRPVDKEGKEDKVGFEKD